MLGAVPRLLELSKVQAAGPEPFNRSLKAQGDARVTEDAEPRLHCTVDWAPAPQCAGHACAFSAGPAQRSSGNCRELSATGSVQLAFPHAAEALQSRV